MFAQPKEHHFCTYFDRNYLARGLVLYHSLSQYCTRPFTLWVLCLDSLTHEMLSRSNLAHLRLLTLEELEAGDTALLKAKAERSAVEYYWSCTPSLPLYILRQNPEIETIAYLDADLCFYADPIPVYAELDSHSVLIIEHRYAPEHEHLAAEFGIYNVGLVIFRNDNNGLNCLHWWRARCLEWCFIRAEEGKFGDQKYLDDWPKRFEGVVVLQNKGAGVAPWNFLQYRIEWNGHTLTIDGQPLIFYHFHAFKNITRMVASPAGNFHKIPAILIKRLYVPYAQALARLEHTTGLENLMSTDTPLPWGLMNDLFEQRWMLCSPSWLALMVWTWGGGQLAPKKLSQNGSGQYEQGKTARARDHLLDAVHHLLLMMQKDLFLRPLVKIWLGADFIARYRHYRSGAHNKTAINP